MLNYVVIDEDGEEKIFNCEPKRQTDIFKGKAKYCHKTEKNIGIGEWIFKYTDSLNKVFSLPQGSIEKLIGRKLTWKDEPVELKED